MNEEPQSWLGMVGKALIGTASYLPPVNQVIHQWRSFASAHLPFCGLRNVCAVTCVQRVPRLLIASADGYLYIYDFNATDGGECTLIKQVSYTLCQVETPIYTYVYILPAIAAQVGRVRWRQYIGFSSR